MPSEAEILDFVGTSFRSIWALELLLMLRRTRDRSWAPPEIIKELRSSRAVVVDALNNLTAAGLVIEEDSGGYRYRGVSGPEEMVDDIERLYAVKPTRMMQKIVNSPNSKLKILSDAFRIRE
jgi:predicted transcriptional regulator